jgi:hypothetical protein
MFAWGSESNVGLRTGARFEERQSPPGVHVSSSDEFGMLANSFITMLEEIGGSGAELVRHRRHPNALVLNCSRFSV